ncbi:transposase [Bradyrhizobium elkanii]|uniref:Transposase n=1 Tax=Bradyrhizobium elkanii TaxID=29448 RepID=A0A4U6RIY3_BRAEL|nr:hypothetical protein [Bradyrhizobium sp. BR2003]TKV74071.1 transposase [Bradyrhizobium elkanii]
MDFRKGADGLTLMAKETLGHDPMKGAAIFRAKRAGRVKIYHPGWSRPCDVR